MHNNSFYTFLITLIRNAVRVYVHSHTEQSSVELYNWFNMGDLLLNQQVVIGLGCGITTLLIAIYIFLSRPKPAKYLPQKMKRLVVVEFPKDFKGHEDFKDFKVAVEEVAIPQPGNGEVLVKMSASVVNPSDQGDLSQAAKGLLDDLQLPRVFGREGSGVVVASGGGLMARSKVGTEDINN